MFLAIIGALTLASFTLHILKMLWEIFMLWYGTLGKTDFIRHKFGNWAVITGSTDGIGKQYAIELAQRGINVVLISRNLDKLNNVAREIESKYGVEAKVIVADFSKGTEVYPHIEEKLRDIPIGILVNNVGVFHEHPARVCDEPVEKIWEMINVNVVTVATLTRMILPGMVERGRGAVVNMSSGSAQQPVPLFAVYASTKAFVRFFTLALQHEYAHTNIEISYLHPMFVSTNMTAFSEHLKRGSIFVPDTVSFAKYAVNSIGRLQDTSGYWSHVLQVGGGALFPEWIRTQLAHGTSTMLFREYQNAHAKSP